MVKAAALLPSKRLNEISFHSCEFDATYFQLYPESVFWGIDMKFN